MGKEFNQEEYWRSKEHYRHAVGIPYTPELTYYNRRLGTELQRVFTQGPPRVQSDKAWTVMLYKQGLITKEVAVKLLKTIQDAKFSSEDVLRKKLDGDEDTASAVNLGRTTQEPMSRLQLRDKMLDIFDLLLKSLGAVLDKAEANVDTIMAGQTHLSHAQPTTYAAYLLSVHDGLARGLELLELAYKHTNENTAGCGALAGTGWPVDRHLVTELLGFDRLVEPVYDCEVAMDHSLTILYALTNIVVLLTRTAIDHEIWATEEIANIALSPDWLAPSSLMPQKAHTGGAIEPIRVSAAEVIGEMMKGVVKVKGEPHQEVLPIQAWQSALRGLCYAERSLGFFTCLLPSIILQKERMLQYARDGFSATPDLAIKLIRDKGLGPRRAHRICATFVRIARERGIKPYETTSELLDEAAKIAGDVPTGLSTEEVREMLDPVKFIERHNNVGDPHPDESRRMIAIRRESLEEAQKRHKERAARIEEAAKKLDEEVKAIL